MPKKGYRQTEEHKRKISETHKGVIPWSKGLTKETDARVKKMSESLEGQKHSEETKKKISKSHKGKKLSEKTRKKMSKAHEGRYPSKETKKKMSISRKGNKNTLGKYWKLSKKTKQKMSKACKGRKHSEETKRKMSEALKGRISPMLGKTGEKAPNWQGGISKEPYTFEFNQFLKEDVKIVNNFECQLCHINEGAHIKRYGRKIPIHHIDYNKKNCDMKNLTVLCLSCNGKVNKNREYWKNFLRRKNG